MGNDTFITSADFVTTLTENGYDFFTGVPCSIFKGLIKYFSDHKKYGYIPAPREDASVGLSTGAFFAGKQPVIIMQNSGLGYCLNALTSLNLIYKIPVLLLISWRGYQGKDAPEHIIMGDICTKLCDISNINYKVLDAKTYRQQLKETTIDIKKSQIPNAIFVKSGVIK